MSLAKNSGIYLSGNLLVRGVGLLTLPIFTRYLAPSEYGLVGLVLAFGMLAFNLSNWGTLDAFARLYFSWYQDREVLRRAFGTLVCFLAGLSVVMGVVLWSQSDRLAVLFLGGAQQAHFILVGLLLALGMQVPELVRTFLINTENPVAHTLYNGGNALAYAVCALIGVVVMGAGIWGMLGGQLIASMLATVIGLWVVRDYVVVAFDWERLRETLQFGIPLLPHVLSGWLSAYVDRLFLAQFSGLREVGVYTVAVTLATGMGLIGQAFLQSWNPHFWRRLEQEGAAAHAELSRTISLAIALLSVVALLAIAVAPEAIPLLVGTAYDQAATVFPVLIGYQLVLIIGQFPAGSLSFIKKTSWYSAVTLTGMGVMVGANLLLIPRFGVMGAALSLFCAGVVTTALYFLMGQRFMRLPYESGRIAAVVVSASVAAVVMVGWGALDGWMGIGIRACALIGFGAAICLSFRLSAGQMLTTVSKFQWRAA